MKSRQRPWRVDAVGPQNQEAAGRERRSCPSGSDAEVDPPIPVLLRGQGISPTEGYAEENIPSRTDVVLSGIAISRRNPGAEAVAKDPLASLTG